MKSRIFMYLFIFAALFVLFQYINTKRYVETTDAKIEILRTKTEKLKDSVQYLISRNPEPGYFSLTGNEEALSYFDDLNIDDLPRYIADKLMETNESKGDNPLIPYAGMSGAMKINKVEILNHKWLIADFSDGKLWGELLITYEFTFNAHIEFTVVKHLLYSGSG